MGVAVTPQEFDLQLPSGRFHAKRYGSADGGLVLGLPGLSANLVSFDFFGQELAPLGMNLVALDLRGRGKSEVTAPGTYGWVNHAKDALALARELGHDRFSILGSSMGGAVAMTCAWLDAAAIERMVLIDICGSPDEASLVPIGAAVNRLGAVFPSTEAYIAVARQLGVIDPWSDVWESYFRYELQDAEGGVTARSDRAAVLEDAAFGAGTMAFGDGAGVYSLWKSLSMPVLLLRAEREILPGFGRIVSDRDRRRFPAEVPTAEVADVDANHYGIHAHPDSAAAVARFFGLV